MSDRDHIVGRRVTGAGGTGIDVDPDRFVVIMQQAGLPDGVLDSVHGPGESVGRAGAR